MISIYPISFQNGGTILPLCIAGTRTGIRPVEKNSKSRNKAVKKRIAYYTSASYHEGEKKEIAVGEKKKKIATSISIRGSGKQ